MLLLAAACSSSSGNHQGAQFQFVTPTSSPVIDQGQSVTVTVSASANWTFAPAYGTPKGTNIGSLSATAGSASAVYTACAPSNTVTCLPNTQVVITATSSADITQTAAITVSIPPPPSVSTTSPVTVSCASIPPGTVVFGFGVAPYSFGWNKNVSKAFDLAATGGVPPYAWSISSGTLPAGLSLSQDFTTNQMSINGAPTSSTCADITLQITDSAKVSTTAAYTILVLPPPLSVQMPPVSTAYVGVPYPPVALVASGGIPPYTWTPDPNQGAIFPPGLGLSVPGSNPNIAVVTGTPSASGFLNSYTPAAFVYDSQSPYPAAAHPGIAMGSGQVIAPNPACADTSGSTTSLATSAPYAFILRGFDSHGPVVIAGNFTTDGAGNIVSGAEDINSSAGVQSNLSLTAGSGYTIGGDNRGCLTLMNSAGATLTFQTAWGTCSTTPNQPPAGGCQNNGNFARGRILLDDPATGMRATGILRLQDPTSFSNSALSGTFAFGFSGWDASGGRYAIAGSTSASSGSFSSVAADINDAGTLGSNLTGGTGSYNLVASGRGTGSISAGSANLGFVIYPVSASEAIFATSDKLDATHPMLSGEALASPSAITAQGLMNIYMVRTSGVAAGAPDPSLGLFTMDGVSAVTGTLYENNGGTLSTNSINGIYQVDATARRIAFTAPTQGQNLGPHPLVGYLVAPASGITAFVVSTDTASQFGVIEYQAQNMFGVPPTVFSNASLVGPRFVSTDELMDASTDDVSGTFFATGNGTLGGSGLTLDAGYVPGSFPGPNGLRPNSVFSASYSIGKTGTGTFTGQFVSVTNGTDLFYLDESPLNLHSAITVAEQ